MAYHSKQDRAHYTCQFENEVKHATAESTMLLRIEHSPVVVHQHNKVSLIDRWRLHH